MAVKNEIMRRKEKQNPLSKVNNSLLSDSKDEKDRCPTKATVKTLHMNTNESFEGLSPVCSG